MDNRKIGIFDSGIGGLTVLSEIQKRLPCEDLIYIGDTKRFPYGNKSKDMIIKIAKEVTQELIDRQVKIVVIACGTATSQALEELKGIFKIPIIGIIDPTIENKIGEKKRVGILATKGTIRSKAWNKAIQNKQEDIVVLAKEAPMLAPMAEEGWVHNEVAKYAVREYVKPMKGKIDQLILGCTHYPLFEDMLKEELGKEVELINTGEEVAYYLEEYLKEKGQEKQTKRKGKEEIYLTDTDCNLVKVAQNLLGKDIKTKIQKIEIE